MNKELNEFGCKLYELHSVFDLFVNGLCDRLENSAGPHDDVIPGLLHLKNQFDALVDMYSDLKP